MRGRTKVPTHLACRLSVCSVPVAVSQHPEQDDLGGRGQRAPMQSPKTIPWIAGLVAVFVSSSSLVALATTWQRPARELTPDERMEMAVSASDAVLVGTLSAVRDSIAQDGGVISWTTINPSRWVRQNGGTGPVRVYFPIVSQDAHDNAARWLEETPSVNVFAFIKRVPRGWVLVENPSYPGGGMIKLSSLSPSVYDTMVDQATTRITPTALGRRADLVVVGQVLATPGRCTAFGSTTKCTSVRVDEVLAGDATIGSTIHIYTLFGGLAKQGRLILFLKRGIDGYEAIGFRKGALPVVNGAIEGTSMTVAALSDSLRPSDEER